LGNSGYRISVAHNPATRDLFGNQVDGWYWQLTEECFEKEVEAFQGVGNWRAAAIVERLVAMMSPPS
jgi:hypothetical protein